MEKSKQHKPRNLMSVLLIALVENLNFALAHGAELMMWMQFSWMMRY